MATPTYFEKFTGTFFSVTLLRSTWPLRWARVRRKEMILYTLIRTAIDRVVYLVCACWLANRDVSVKSRRHVNYPVLLVTFCTVPLFYCTCITEGWLELQHGERTVRDGQPPVGILVSKGDCLGCWGCRSERSCVPGREREERREARRSMQADWWNSMHTLLTNLSLLSSIWELVMEIVNLIAFLAFIFVIIACHVQL